MLFAVSLKMIQSTMFELRAALNLKNLIGLNLLAHTGPYFQLFYQTTQGKGCQPNSGTLLHWIESDCINSSWMVRLCVCSLRAWFTKIQNTEYYIVCAGFVGVCIENNCMTDNRCKHGGGGGSVKWGFCHREFREWAAQTQNEMEREERSAMEEKAKRKNVIGRKMWI